MTLPMSLRFRVFGHQVRRGSLGGSEGHGVASAAADGSALPPHRVLSTSVLLLFLHVLGFVA